MISPEQDFKRLYFFLFQVWGVLSRNRIFFRGYNDTYNVTFMKGELL